MCCDKKISWLDKGELFSSMITSTGCLIISGIDNFLLGWIWSDFWGFLVIYVKINYDVIIELLFWGNSMFIIISWVSLVWNNENNEGINKSKSFDEAHMKVLNTMKYTQKVWKG